MITVKVFKDSKKNYRGFTLKGHSGYANSGKDIVCSAVSILSINTVNSIEKFTEDKFSCTDDDGFLTFSFTEESISPESRLLIESFILGIEGIEQEYPKYIQISYKEV